MDGKQKEIAKKIVNLLKQPTAVTMLDDLDDSVKKQVINKADDTIVDELVEGTTKAKFGSAEKLKSQFAKHGKEFKGVYNNADEYLQGARDVMKNGTKVSYNYKEK